jgi:tetratricopeptide (TPR) repeat protein/transcriptional regulator with XRE-family HTH domain
MLGDVVRAHRLRLGQTQEELAERAGVSPRSIRNIETGRTALPRASTVRLLATAFGLTGQEYDEFCATRAQPPDSDPDRPTAELVSTPAPAGSSGNSGRLPPDLPDYTGNDAIVATVETALTAAPAGTGGLPAVVVAGQGGVGKTSLAVHIAHRMAPSFPDGQLFVSFRGTNPEPTTTADAMARVLRGLGDDGVPSTDLDEGIDRYRAQLAGRRVLIVLDDAAGAAQVRPFLPNGPGSAVLVSTRARLTTLAGVRHIDLDVLDEPDAIALLERIVGADRIGAEPEAVRTLVRQCARLPLALRVVGARLAARPHWQVARLVARMSDERRRLDELAIDDLAVRAGLAVSYRGLDPRAQRALRALAYLDPPDFAAWTPAAMLEVDLTEAEDIVEQLLDTRLVEVVSLGGIGTRYRMHDLVRLYARELALSLDTESDLRIAVTRAVSLGLQQVERRSERLLFAVPRLYRPAGPVSVDPALIIAAGAGGREWFEAEEPSLVAAVERAAALEMDDLACALADALIFATFALLNNFTGWNRVHRAALAAARSAENLRAEAVIECGLGQLRYKEDHFADARVHFERALTLFRQDKDERGEIIAMNGLGTVCREVGDHETSILLQGQAGAALEELGDEEGAAHAHYGLGYSHRELGDDVRAIEHLARALELFRKVRHRRGEAVSIRGIGLVHRARGELAQAEDYCARAHEIAVGTGDRLLTSYTSQALAKIWVRQDNPERAREPLTQGLATCIELHDRLGTALIHRTLGEMHLAAGDPEAALADLSAALLGWQALGHDLWQARTLRDIGAAQAALGDGSAAHRSWARAQTTFDVLGTRERTELTEWRRRWGCTCAPETLALAGVCV